jgi:hypothetical protein
MSFLLLLICIACGYLVLALIGWLLDKWGDDDVI